MKNKKLLSVIGLAAVAALLLALWRFTLPQTQEGAKTIVVEVVHGDQTSKEFTYQTDAEYLGQVLMDEKLVQGENGPYGLYITVVDGVKAQESEHQWWCLTKNGGQQVDTGVDKTPIADGDRFELTLMIY